MNVQIKSEKLSDYCAITNVNNEAFHGGHPDNWHVSDPVMVDLLKPHDDFNPDLSLIADIAGEVSGHVLLSIYQFIVADTVQKSTVSATVAFKPDSRQKGVGVTLLKGCHYRTRAKRSNLSRLYNLDTCCPVLKRSA